MLSDLGIDNIYIIHAKKGYEFHEKRINKLFKTLGFKYEFVVDGDPSEMTDDIFQKYFHPKIKERFSIGVQSCTLNHIFSYEKMVANKERYALIFENDPFFLGDFIKKISKVANEMKTLPPGFIISLENTSMKFPSFFETKRGKYLYEANYGRCAGGYLIDYTGAKKVLENLKTERCEQVIDWWHNTLIKNEIIKMYWAHPPLIEQGSHNGKMNSTISSKNRSIIRQFQWNSQKIYKMYFLRLFKKMKTIL